MKTNGKRNTTRNVNKQFHSKINWRIWRTKLITNTENSYRGQVTQVWWRRWFAACCSFIYNSLQELCGALENLILRYNLSDSNLSNSNLSSSNQIRFPLGTRGSEGIECTLLYINQRHVYMNRVIIVILLEMIRSMFATFFFYPFVLIYIWYR